MTHEEEYKGYKIEIHQDECGESPREWDNICIIHTGHKRYSIGDKNYNDRESIDEAFHEAKENGDIVLPLYLYDHSGITISLSPFSCPWDSGQVGFVVVPRLKMIEEFGKKNFTLKLKARALEIAESEVNTLDQFIRGEVYGYKVFGEGDDGDREELDSCWGYYGEEDAITEAKSIVDYYVEEKEKECIKSS